MFSNPCNTVTDESSDCISAELMENDRLLLIPHSVRIQWAVFGSCPPHPPPARHHQFVTVRVRVQFSRVQDRRGSAPAGTWWHVGGQSGAVQRAASEEQETGGQGKRGKSWTVRKGTGHIRGGWKKWTFHLKFDSATGRSDGAPWTW